MLQIRKADSKDAGIIAPVARQTFSESFGHLFKNSKDLDTYLDNTFSVNKLTSSLSKDENIFWISFWNDQPIGYAKLKLNSANPFVVSSKICQLQKIYILKSFLSQKVGSKLQAILLNEAKERAYDTIWLSVWTGNERAIRFYERNEFKKLGNHQFSIGKETFNFDVLAKKLMV